MGYSMKDLNNAATNLKNRMDARSEEKGRRMADSIIRGTSRGRGVWCILLWTAWFMIFVFVGSLCVAMLEQFGVPPPFHWAGMLGGAIVAAIWYDAEFTREHPFLSFLLGGFGVPLILVHLMENLW